MWHIPNQDGIYCWHSKDSLLELRVYCETGTSLVWERTCVSLARVCLGLVCLLYIKSAYLTANFAVRNTHGRALRSVVGGHKGFVASKGFVHDLLMVVRDCWEICGAIDLCHTFAKFCSVCSSVKQIWTVYPSISAHISAGLAPVSFAWSKL